EPTQQPPQAARVHPGVLIVRRHVHAIGDAPRTEDPTKRLRFRQRMAPAGSRFRTGEIVRQMGVDRARNVRAPVVEAAPVLIVQFVAQVDEGEGGVGEPFGDLVRGDERSEGHRRYDTDNLVSLRTMPRSGSSKLQMAAAMTRVVHSLGGAALVFLAGVWPAVAVRAATPPAGAPPVPAVT